MIKYFIVSNENNLRIEGQAPSLFQKRLADFLTFSRVIISLVILSLSFVGQDAYMIVVVLVLIGAATDILDGRVARHYLVEHRESHLGKYDLEVDTFFILCTISYLSFSGIVIPKIIGFAWIGLAVIAAVIYKRKPKILVLIEIPSVIALLLVSAVYNFESFILIVVPAMIIGLIINRKRVFYLIFEYWPKIFSE